MLVAEGRWEELKILTKLCTQMHDLASRFFKDTKYWQQMLYRYKCLKKNICLKMGIMKECRWKRLCRSKAGRFILTIAFDLLKKN